MQCSNLCLIFGLFLNIAHAAPFVDASGTTFVPSLSSPKRIVTLVPSAAEMVFDIIGLQEAQNRIAGVSEYTDFPKSLVDKPKVGSYVAFELERVLALKPDLVIATTDGNPRERVLRLRSLGVPVLVIAQNSFNEIFQAYEWLGLALHEAPKSAEVVNKFKEKLNEFSRENKDILSQKNQNLKKVVLQIGENPMVVIGQGTFLSEIIDFLGVINLFGKSGVRYPRPGYEQVLALKPQHIVLVEMGDAQNVHDAFVHSKQKWEGLLKKSGLSGTQVSLLKLDEIVRPSLRMLIGIDRLAQEIKK